MNQAIHETQENIAALEEYCLNVDHHNIPPPDKLSYLFQKTQGTYRFLNGTYSGSLFRGKPWGTGTTIYDNGNTYEGQYVNGKKHGDGIFTFEEDGEKREGTFKKDKRDGITRAVYPDGSEEVSVWKEGIPQFMTRRIRTGGPHSYINMKDGKKQGHMIEYYTTEDYIVVYTYDSGDKQGKGKKYTYKEQVD